MLRSLARNGKMQVMIVLLVALFFALRWLFDPNMLMSILNGVFAGAVVTIIASYYRLIVSAIRGESEYDRVQLMTLGLFLLWASVVVSVAVSIYARSTEYDIANYTGAAASRYIAIIAAVLQLRSLDYGFALFHSRDKAMIWASLILGIVVAIATIALQQQW